MESIGVHNILIRPNNRINSDWHSAALHCQPVMRSVGPLQMKQTTLILAIFVGLLTSPLLIHSAGTTSVRTVFVFKLDGTKHCEPYAGVSLDAMALELRDAGIEVFSSRKGYDGHEGIAICGEPTGQINIYEILSSDLALALSMDFKQLPENWLRKDSGEGTRPNHSLQTDPEPVEGPLSSTVSVHTFGLI